jgi:hypothetical protein
VDVDEAIDHLYGLPLDRFTAERDELARRLRQEGARADGDRVKALRKPSVAAWAVNRVARGDADGVHTLLASVDELREAQADAVRGDAARFRDAAEAHRVALDRLADEGVAALEEAGGASASIADRVRQTLQAAAQDPAVRDDLAAGRLTRELQPGGIDALGLAGAVPVGRDAGRRRVAGDREVKAAGAARGGGAKAATKGGRPAKTSGGKAAAKDGGGAKAKGSGAKAAAREAAAPGSRPPAGERRRARDAARAAEQRAESARRRLARAEEAVARARDALEEAQAAVAAAEEEARATSARERELSGDG